jgi:hypothetical protein
MIDYEQVVLGMRLASVTVDPAWGMRRGIVNQSSIKMDDLWPVNYK